jgi:hypothetical protein
MFDPNHNAHANYYLVRGDLTGSWLGLDSDIIIAPWDYTTRAASLQFFARLGNRQVIAGYYDSDPSLVTNWLSAASPYTGISGVMYTTWQNNYSNLGSFEQYISGYPAPTAWLTPRLLGAISPTGQPQVILEGERGRHYLIEQTSDLSHWNAWTNVTAPDATIVFAPPALDGPGFFRAACTQ